MTYLRRLLLSALLLCGGAFSSQAQTLTYNTADGSWDFSFPGTLNFYDPNEGGTSAAAWGNNPTSGAFSSGIGFANIEGTTNQFFVVNVYDNDSNSQIDSVVFFVQPTLSELVTTEFTIESFAQNFANGLIFESTSFASQNPNSNNGLTVNVVPEPTSMALLIGAAGLLAYRRRR